MAKTGDIFLTHGHFDHAMDVPLLLSLGKSKVFCSRETVKVLKAEGVAKERLNVVEPGDVIESGPFSIRVLAGEHSQPDMLLKLKTFMSPLMLLNWRTFITLYKAHRKYKVGTVLVYQIEAGSKSILHMGSLNLSADEVYPEEVDLLTIPFQGRSDLNVYALQFVNRIKPKALLLHHFDNTFPPISRYIDAKPFVRSVQDLFPETAVIIPEYRRKYLV